MRYKHHREPQEALRVRLRELAGSLVRYGYRGLTVLLKREGWEVNAKRIYRLYVEEGLMVRIRKRKERAQRQRVPFAQSARPNQKWSMDFVAQRLADGCWMRVLTVVDQFTRECLCLQADGTLNGEKVAVALDNVIALRGAPQSIMVDNGREFTSHKPPVKCGPNRTAQAEISNQLWIRFTGRVSKPSVYGGHCRYCS